MYTSSTELLVITSRSARSQDLNARLNVEGLKTAVSRAIGIRCIGLKIKAEGGFNRVYFAQFYGGAEYVVRVAFDRSEYRGMHKMESEVATIAWLVQNTDIPVPTILYHSPTDKNEAHAPFMIMEKVRDMTLDKRWQTMSLAEKHVAVKSIAKIIVSLAQTHFDRIGSIYPSSSTGSGVVIGPMLPTSLAWFYTPDVSLDSGPWNTERDYFSGCIAREHAWAVSHHFELEEKWQNENIAALGWESILSGYLAVYDRLTQLVSHLPGLDPRLPHPFGPFVLVHPDLNSRNVMISAEDPSQLTILDWECSRTAPLWALTTVPEFLSEGEDVVDPSCPELRQVFHAACELYFPHPALWRSLRDRADLMVALEKACQSVCRLISPATIVYFLDQVLTKCQGY
ncbi:kinase-like protein [Hymenopellis radicata]|nr:kinase-like protein [Hymenopellis radicata]